MHYASFQLYTIQRTYYSFQLIFYYYRILVSLSLHFSFSNSLSFSHSFSLSLFLSFDLSVSPPGLTCSITTLGLSVLLREDGGLIPAGFGRTKAEFLRAEKCPPLPGGELGIFGVAIGERE